MLSLARKRQLLKFFLVGAANTCLDFGLFNFLVWLLAPKGTLLFLVNLLSVSLAAGQSFLLHRSWTFTAKGRVSLQLGRFFIATGGGIILNSLLVLFASKWAQFSSIPQLLFLNSGKALAAIASGTWNFLLYKYWVFLPERVSSFPEEGKKGLVSVVIPAFNEEKRLPERLAALIATLPRFFPTELIVVDDGSLDGTRQLAQKWAETAPCVQVIGYDKNQGKGEAVRVGMEAAKGEYLLFTDADSTFTPAHLKEVVEALSQADVVIGRRDCGEERLKGESKLRRFLGSCFSRLVRCFFLPEIPDSQCGLKGFTRSAAREIFPRQTLRGFAFDVELLVLARGLGFEVRELPVQAQAAAGSKVKLRDCLFMCGELLVLGRNLLLNRYGFPKIRARYADLFLAASLFAVSFLIRLPWLWEVPRYIDELREVDLAYQIYQGSARPLHNAARDIGALHNYILAGIFKLLGPNIWLPRLYTAALGSMSVVVLYYLGKLLFGKKVGLLAAVFLAANCMHVLVTHMAWSNSTTPFFFLLALFATFKAEKNGRLLPLAGFLWALALQTHSSVLISVVVTGLYFARRKAANLPRAAVAFLFGYWNMLYYNLRTPLGSISWLSRKAYTLEQQPGLASFFQNAGKMLLQFLRTISSSYLESPNPLAYLAQPHFTLALAAFCVGCYYAKKEGRVLLLWLLGGSFAVIPWLNSRYSFYLPTRYIMPQAVLGLLLAARGAVALGGFIFKNQKARQWAEVFALVLVALQLLPHYRYCRELAGTSMANTLALEITEQVGKRAEKEVLLDPKLPIENNPLPVLFSLAGLSQNSLAEPAAAAGSPGSLALLSEESYHNLQKTVPLQLLDKFSCRLYGREGKRTIYLVEFLHDGLPAGSFP